MKGVRFYVILSGLFFILDRFFKHWALNSTTTVNIDHQRIGWHPFFNHAAAFGLPVPNFLTIILSLPILILLCLLTWRNLRLHPNISGSFLLIIAGALSNLLDRVFLNFTIDYWRFFSGFINLADVLIVAGIFLFVLAEQKISAK